MTVSDNFKGETANVEESAEDVSKADEREGSDCGVWDGVNGENGHKAEGDPGCLAYEGYKELWRGFLDLIEAGVFPV